VVFERSVFLTAASQRQYMRDVRRGTGLDITFPDTGCISFGAAVIPRDSS
jgi:hypothetical protein